MTDKIFKEILKSQVIKGYFTGKTREEIAIQNNTSTGNVSHIRRDFEKKVGESAVDETIEFARMIRKSGITMTQCLEGFRMHMLMDKLGITADDDSDDKNKEFQDFVNEIYFPCKELGIHPTWIFKWIKDLLNLSGKLKNIRPLDSIYIDSSSTKQDANSFEDSLEIDDEQYTKRSKLEDDNQLPLINCNSAVDAALLGTDKTEHPLQFSYSQPPNSSPSNAHGLLLSDIVTLISQVQTKGKAICNYQHKLKNETIKMENTFTKVKDSLQKTKIRNQKILHFEGWFYRAKEVLWKLHGIRIETVLPKFIKAISEFNRHNHDPYEIIKEYMNHQKMDKEIAEKNIIIEGQKRQIKTHQGHINSVKARLECNKNMERTVEKFESINFGIDDLIRIHNLMVKTASIKNIPVDTMVKIVVDDMEKNYYNGLLFSDLANKRKAEYIDLIRQQSYYSTAFEENYYCKVALAQLLNRGISQKDITNVNLIIVELEKRNFYAKNIQSNDIVKTMDIKAVNIANNYNALISDLRKYVTLAIACEEKQHELDEKNKYVNRFSHDNQPPILQIGKISSYTFITNYRIPYDLL